MVDVLFYIGVLQLTVVFLAIAAGVISINLFRISKKQKVLEAWMFMMVVLVLFALTEIAGVLDAFGIYPPALLFRFIGPSFILVFLILAIVRQIRLSEVQR